MIPVDSLYLKILTVSFSVFDQFLHENKNNSNIIRKFNLFIIMIIFKNKKYIFESYFGEVAQLVRAQD